MRRRYGQTQYFGQSQPKIPRIVKPNGKTLTQSASKLGLDRIPELKIPKFNNIHEKSYKFFQLYEQLFNQNDNLNNQLAQAIQNRNQLAQRFNAIKRSKVGEETVKRKRRYARDIERQFYCPVDKCHRGYGSQGSLSHHVRLKHLDFYESGKYEIFIQQYIDNMQNKKENSQKNRYQKLQENMVKIEENQSQITPIVKGRTRQKKVKKESDL